MEQGIKNARDLQAAKELANRSGKEVFDFDKLCLFYDPDSNLACTSQPISNKQSNWFEFKYYVRFPDCRTIEAFAEKMREMDETIP